LGINKPDFEGAYKHPSNNKKIGIVQNELTGRKGGQLFLKHIVIMSPDLQTTRWLDKVYDLSDVWRYTSPISEIMPDSFYQRA